MIEGLKALGKTVFLTTHYMEEAQHLADRVVIIARGKIVAEGKPDELGAAGKAGATVVRFRLPPGYKPEQIAAEVDAEVEVAGGVASFEADRAQRALYRLTGWAEREGIELEDLEVRRPSLEDVFPPSRAARRRDERRRARLPPGPGDGLKSLSRNPRALVFGVVFPVILFIMFASIFAKGGDETTRVNGELIGADAYFAAGMIAYAIMMAAFYAAIALTSQRESGLLKRFRGPPSRHGRSSRRRSCARSSRW